MKKTAFFLTFFTLIASSATASPISITASELYEEYRNNKVRANSKFKGKQLLVKGRVEEIDSIFGDPVVHLETSNWIGFVSAEFKSSQKERIIELDKGQSVQLLCTGNGTFLTMPELKNCVFAK